jgi:integrase
VTSYVPPLEPWTHTEGSRKSRVVVYEDVARGGMLTLRWRDAKTKNWRRKTLGKVMERDRKGPLAELVAFAENEARRKSVQLSDGTEPAATKIVAPFTIGDTKDAITDKQTGKYPHNTPFRRELLKAVEFAGVVWGSDTAWKDITEDQWMSLLRRRVEHLIRQGKRATRTTEITISRLITVTRWLRRTKRIPADAGHAPEDWKEQIVAYWKGETGTKRDPEPHQPRHTLEEMRKILGALDKIEPRVALLLAVGAEYRLGQVVRCLRSDLDLERGTLLIHGVKHKEGETVELTEAQLAFVRRVITDGYLADCEAKYDDDEKDYPLFPGGKTVAYRTARRTVGKGAARSVHLSRRAINRRFHEAERLACVPEIAGRGPYGLRRQNVDAALLAGITPQGLKSAGGWKSTKIPTEVYAEKENRAGRSEAKRVRSATRGEA